MSIEMENPQSLLEKIDAAANLVQQMYLAHVVGDNEKFKEVHAKATTLLAEATDMADNLIN